ncbi:MAG: tRNA pseudouridine(55) synthase TruB, partial [Bacteroidota bacterium]
KATGLLILCTGKQTKSLSQFTGLDKEYVGTFELGVRTPSLDSETEVVERFDYSAVTIDGLRSTARTFIGKQQQKPPMYSAAKYGGKPLYKYARQGRTLDRASKEIEVSEFEIRSFASPLVEFRVVCSKGTYVRSLVDDLGTALGCGASLRALRRTRIGPFRVEGALSIQELESLKHETTTQQHPNHETCIPD